MGNGGRDNKTPSPHLIYSLSSHLPFLGVLLLPEFTHSLGKAGLGLVPLSLQCHPFYYFKVSANAVPSTWYTLPGTLFIWLFA